MDALEATLTEQRDDPRAPHAPRRGAGQRALALAAGGSLALAATKFGLGLASGSLVVLASAADSFADVLMSGLNWWGYRHARIPADEDHPYGHGKFEGALAVGQGMLLLGIVVSLVASAVAGLVQGRPAPQVDLAVATLVGSGLAAGVLTWLLRRASARDRSVVVDADAAHYAIDMLSAAAAVAGLLLVGATGQGWLDPAATIALAGLMAREGWKVFRRGLAELLDEALPEEALQRVHAVLDRYADRVVGFHGLRSRRSGPLSFVEVHVVLPGRTPLGEAHRLVQEIGEAVRGVLEDRARVLVHPDAQGMADAVDESLEEGAPL